MSVLFAYGPVGSGKSYFGAAWANDLVKKGRRVYSSFPIKGCRGLTTLAHAWCKEFRGSDFIIDETGSQFNARSWQHLDALIFGALTHSRHQDINVLFLVQHPMYAEVNFRRLAEAFILCERHGPEGERWAPVELDDGTIVWPKKPWFWQRPRSIHTWWYPPVAFTDDYKLKSGALHMKHKRYGFKWPVARSYNSFNKHIPPHLRAEVASLEEGAAACAEIPEWEFVNGVPIYRELTEEQIAAMTFPIPATELIKKKDVSPEAVEVARRAHLADLGFFPVGTAPVQKVVQDKGRGRYEPVIMPDDITPRLELERRAVPEGEEVGRETASV